MVFIRIRNNTVNGKMLLHTRTYDIKSPYLPIVNCFLLQLHKKNNKIGLIKNTTVPVNREMFTDLKNNKGRKKQNL